MPEFTDEQYRQWARDRITSATDEADDWGGIGEMLTEPLEEAGLTYDNDPDGREFDRHRQRVADLIAAATITVSWPDGQPTGQDGDDQS